MREPAKVKERRREPRARVARPVYVETTDPQGEHFEEIRTTRDLAHWGFYFVTEKGAYWPGMRVCAIPWFGCLNYEYEGQVVRVERLRAGEFGVAIRLLCVRDPIATPNTLARSTFHSFARAHAALQPAHE